jgi:capsular polysaccharide transport system permease protein
MNAESTFPLATETQDRPSPFAQWLRKRRWFIIFVILPTVLAAIYYGFFASDIYVSESRFVIKSPSQKQASMSSLANLIQTTGLSGGQEQTNEVLAYTQSRDALKALEKNPGIRGQFATPHADILSRFPFPLTGGSFEDLYKFYGKMVTTRLDTENNTAVITVKAFSAADAYQINEHLLELSEDLVNRLNTRAQQKGIAEAERQVDLATQRAKAARTALAQYRNAQAVIDPGKQAAGVLEIANGMVAERAKLQAQLDLMQRLTPNNPSIPALRNRISAVSAQIGAQDSRVVGTNDGIASKMGGYENLLVEQEFSTQSLNVANASLVQARADAQKQQFYLERVVDPNMPDTPLLPKRFLSILAVAASALCIYFIAWMFIIGILEHAPEQ